MNINDILRANPVSAKYGAPMGASSDFDPDSPILYVQRVDMADGDYSPDGTYWGAGPKPLYCGFNGVSRVYVRAKTRADAVALIVRQYPDAVCVDDFDSGAFLSGYIECALWSSTDPDTSEPLDDGYGSDDIAPECLASMRETCADFIASNAADLAEYCNTRDESSAGHDFWLTRNSHGAGFWDRGLGALGERLADAARVYGNADLYPGDDGLIYGE